ncbi:hypothetical protein FUA26_02505 [Seonamhaeicola algicola]|uniref:Uncharacterized protein n=1 Tax=Seonamhaeicola algicola TaxID=1719036 RepID=A0A5C7AYA2_9FLAO|nr:hypothetical protein [Seonamhaeicola algicola]TXE13786.1 hypothetical protein FUA26_02505 [Seonamhaeicola algicola]
MELELTEKECLSIDNALKKYLDLFHEEIIYQNRFPFLLKESGINENRINFILTELAILNLVSFKNNRGDKTLSHNFNRNEIHSFLKNGGMTNKWLEIESKRTDLKLSKETLKEFPRTKWFARIGAFIGIVLALKELIEWKMKLP